MNERIKKNGYTITPEVPSIDLMSRIIEIELPQIPMDMKPGDKYGCDDVIQWVNRFNNTIGVRPCIDPFSNDQK